MKYKIDIEYLVPEFAEVELEAEDEANAKSKAMDIFYQEYPEGVDAVVVKVHGD